MDSERMLHLFAKKLANEATTEELLKLEQLEKRNPDITAILKQVAKYWNTPETDDEASARIFKNISKLIKK